MTSFKRFSVRVFGFGFVFLSLKFVIRFRFSFVGGTKPNNSTAPSLRFKEQTSANPNPTLSKDF